MKEGRPTLTIYPSLLIPYSAKVASSLERIAMVCPSARLYEAAFAEPSCKVKRCEGAGIPVTLSSLVYIANQPRSLRAVKSRSTLSWLIVVEVGKRRSLCVDGERTKRLTEEEETACWTTILAMQNRLLAFPKRHVPL